MRFSSVKKGTNTVCVSIMGGEGKAFDECARACSTRLTLHKALYSPFIRPQARDTMFSTHDHEHDWPIPGTFNERAQCFSCDMRFTTLSPSLLTQRQSLRVVPRTTIIFATISSLDNCSNNRIGVFINCQDLRNNLVEPRHR